MGLINIGEVDLYYESHGSGPALIFAAGLGGRGIYWQNQIEEFSQDYRVIVFDHRGVGKSGPADPPFSISGLAEDVIGLMDALDIKKAIYIGHSTGGAMGQYLAVHHPDRFNALVLSATWRHADTRFREVFEARKEVLVAQGREAYIRQSLPYTYTQDWYSAHTDDLSDVIAKAVAGLPSTEVVIGRLDAILDSNHDDGGAINEMPILVTCAEDDFLVLPSYAREVARNCANAQTHVLKSGGHHFPTTKPKEFNRILRDFLKSVERSLS